MEDTRTETTETVERTREERDVVETPTKEPETDQDDDGA